MAVVHRRRVHRRTLEFLLIGLAVSLTIAVGVGATIHAYQVRMSHLSRSTIVDPLAQHAAYTPAQPRN